MIACAGCASERELPDGESAGIHPSGFLDEGSDNFHGKDLARRGYDLALCASCHGEDFTGGAAKVTCMNCHPAGPDACETCHRGGPNTGRHALHRAAGHECAECHVVPARWDAEGHVRRGGEADPPPAEITFGALANTTLAPTDRPAPASYDGARCNNVYCHGAVLHAGGGSSTAPGWNDPTPAGQCTSCHGAPPPSHAQSECASCHGAAPHLDGAVQVGGDCEGCHRSAPFANLAGSTLTGDLVVGAHEAHLTGASRLRGPIACTECHRVPQATGDAGHIDTALPAEVFPAGSGTLARTDGAEPAWNRSSATCTNSYCHGGGAALASDTSLGLLRAPDWTIGDQAYCGACHGIPPSSHAPSLGLGECSICHPSVDGFGNPLFDAAGASRHLDGVIDVN